jgi:hypothetical protein
LDGGLEEFPALRESRCSSLASFALSVSFASARAVPVLPADVAKLPGG